MATDNAKFLGIEKKQIPAMALLLLFGVVMITLQLEMWSDIKAFGAEVRASTAEVEARAAASKARAAEIRAESEARANAIRADMMNDLRADFYALTVEMSEMNARLDALELAQTSLSDRLDALAAAPPE